MVESDSSDGPTRPTSAREGMKAGGKEIGGSRGLDPEGSESPPPEAPEHRPEEASGDSPDEAEAQRPTPVREMMAPDVGPSGTDWEPPRRTFEHEGKEWVVTLAGQTVTGLPPDPGAPLMSLHFAPAEAPETPEKELLCVGRSLDALYDEELRQYLERARPYEERSA